MVMVKIVRENLHREKPFLGGFRNKQTAVVYHHASSQTVRKRKSKGVPKAHRETQTCEFATRSQQTNRESGTQMDRKDLYIDHSGDRTLFARRWMPSEELLALRDNKAREVQCFIRQCFAWRRVRRLREARYEEEFKTVQQREEQEAKAQAEHKRQIDRRMHPRTKEDFDILSKELEAWRLHETQRIKNSGASKESVHFQLEELLGKEVKLLQTIDRLKITASKENKKSNTKEMLEKMASPKEWATSDGDLIEVETPFSKRAKELVELYNGLCLTNLSKLQRVDVLLHVKYTVKEFDCDLTRDIVALIQREVRCRCCFCWCLSFVFWFALLGRPVLSLALLGFAWLCLLLLGFDCLCLALIAFACLCLPLLGLLALTCSYLLLACLVRQCLAHALFHPSQEDLIRRGRSDKSLDALRKRLSNLFLQFIDVPEFNPEAANFQKVPYEAGK